MGKASNMTPPSSGSDLAVRARGLTRTFGEGVGVHGLDLDVDRGTIFGFIGPSGSGKTTTIRLMTGIMPPESGELTVLGKSPADFDQDDRDRLGYMPQLSVLYPHLSIWENLGFSASLFGVPWRGRRARMMEQLELVELDDARTRLLRDASGGMQRRLALAATLIHNPDLLFLDEPTAGLDPILRKKVWDHFGELRDQGRTLFITTQYVGEAAFCDRVGVLAEGRLIAVDSPDGLRRQAFGGEVLDVVFSQPLPSSQLDQLVEAAEAGGFERIAPHEVRLVVADAGEASPQVTAWAADAGIEIESVEPFLPAFDDVFVELVSKLTNGNGSNGSRKAAGPELISQTGAAR
jgi:ABC-2 type transport system ATP-binding protein